MIQWHTSHSHFTCIHMYAVINFIHFSVRAKHLLQIMIMISECMEYALKQMLLKHVLHIPTKRLDNNSNTATAYSKYIIVRVLLGHSLH